MSGLGLWGFRGLEFRGLGFRVQGCLAKLLKSLAAMLQAISS